MNDRRRAPRAAVAHVPRVRAVLARAALAGAVLTGAALALAGAGPAALVAQEAGAPGDALGQQVYERWCAACHGSEGRGDGPGAGYMLPRPRDFTQALYQIRSTASGELPTDADIQRVVELGMPGTTMPGWSDRLTRREIEAVVQHVKTFSRFFANGDAPEPLAFGGPPAVSEEVLAEGRDFYERIECNKCHGEAGRGDGSSAPTLEDDLDVPARAADLTEGWLFNGGGSVEEIYRRLRTGLDGTPMPSFSDLLDADFMTDAQLWSVAHYVRSLSPERPPSVTEVIRAGLVPEDGEVPSTVDDPAWDAAPSFYVPMVGQIVVSPRWFDPRVDGLWVQGLHDGRTLALRVRWSDPSRSPDASWAPWRARVGELMEPHEGTPVDPATPLPDRLAIQLPLEIPEGMDRPYFLMGDARNPVYLWQWEAGAGVTEAIARGMTSVTPQEDGGQSLELDEAWADGQWTIVARRALTNDDEEDLQLATARAVPVAFSAWDGDNGETGTRRSVSSWYFIHLEEATPATVVVAPVLATLLTAGLGLMVVARAQRRERRAGQEGPDDS
jgi:mono/diheme cytochrome c family protein